MADTLTPEQARIVSGTMKSPAWCNNCLAYTKIFNRCAECGRDERARYGCEHRIGVGGICNQCRGKESAQEALHDLRGELGTFIANREQLLWLLHRFASLSRSRKHMSQMLALQVEASELLGLIRSHVAQGVDA